MSTLTAYLANLLPWPRPTIGETSTVKHRVPAATAARANLVAAPDGTWACFVLGDCEHEGASGEERDSRIADLVARLVDLTHDRVWLRGTSQEWSAQDHYDALTVRYPNLLPDRVGARTADDMLRTAAVYPEAIGAAETVNVIAVRFTRRSIAREHLHYITAATPPAAPLGIIGEDRESYRRVAAVVARAGLVADPMSEAGVEWLCESSLTLGHDNGVVGDPTSEDADPGTPARVSVAGDPYDPTLAVTAIRGSEFHTRHITLRHLDKVRPWDTNTRWPLFGWLNARAVEWVACFDVWSGDDVAPVAKKWAKVAREREKHDDVHGVPLDEGVTAAVDRSREIVAEVEHGDVEDATRVWGRVMVAISGDTREDCIAAATEFCSDASRYMKSPFVADFGMDADRWLFLPGEPWPKFEKKDAGHVLHWTAAALAACGPGVTGRAGDQVGFPLGPMAGSASVYRWHPHAGPESDQPGTFAIIGQQGCGKTSLAGGICDWTASLGIATRVFDPSGKMGRLAVTPHLRADATEFPLTTAGKPGILMPHYLDLDPKRSFYPDGPDGDEEWADAVAGTRAVRMDRAIDATMMLLPYALTSQDRDVLSIVEAAVAKVGGGYGTHSREIIDAIRGESQRGSEIAGLLETRAALPDGLLIFPDRDVSDAVLDRITADSALAVITTPGLVLPETSDRSAWTRENHRAALICTLGWQLAVRDAWASQDPTTVWVDELGVLMDGVASIASGVKRASFDSRKVDLAIGFGAQTASPFHRIDPEVEGLIGTAFIGHTSSKVTARAALPLMGVEEGQGWEGRITGLPSTGDSRSFIVCGLDGRPREVAIDQQWWHPDLVAAVNTTPPAHVATIPDRLRA